MSGQLPLEFSDGVLAAEAWSEVLDAFNRDLIAGMRLKEAASRLGLQDGVLRHKLDAGKTGHVLHAREFFLLLFTASDSQRRTILERIARECGYAVEPLAQRTPEEELADLRERVAKEFGRAGEKVIAQAGGRR